MKGIIFDFDGTMADTNQAIVCSYQETFRCLGLPIPAAEQITPCIGLVSEKIFPILDPGFEMSRLNEAVLLNRENFYKVGAPKVVIFDHVLKTLSTLKQRGLKLAIASSRNTPSLEFLVDKLGMREYFDIIIGAEAVEHHKPAPDMVNLILARWQMEPSDAMVVGDTVFDLGMGRNAGALTCGVTYGNHDRTTLLAESPDFLIDSFHELTKVCEAD